MMPASARDSLALPLAIALVMARLGCFANGCCGGAETSLCWGVDFGDGVRRHPTQLYESGFHLLSGAAIVWLCRKPILRGEVLRLYLVAYCVYRFATEWIRLEPATWLGMTYSQGVVAALGTALVIFWGFEVVGRHWTGPRRVLSRRVGIRPQSPEVFCDAVAVGELDKGPP
jgi:phosphatidylglycerol:prolipoprotein diacylglycerol transferase